MVTLNLEVLTRTAQRRAHNGVRLRVLGRPTWPSLVNAGDPGRQPRKITMGLTATSRPWPANRRASREDVASPPHEALQPVDRRRASHPSV